MIRRRMLAAMIAGLAFAGLGAAVIPARAAAGQWVQVACENPGGSSAPSQGWTGTSSGGLVAPAATSTACGAGSPMSAVIPMSTTATDNGMETLTYTPPPGSTLAGGTLAVQLSADGYGSLPQPASSGVTQVTSPAPGDWIESCGAWWYGCFAGTADPNGGGTAADFTGTVTLPTDAGGTIVVDAECAAYAGAPPCNMGGSNGDWAAATVSEADPLLSVDATPAGSGFTGTLLDADARGNTQLDFNASESAGPGIYSVNVDIDGSSVYSGTPNTSDGECVSEGTFAGTSAMEFDYAQPCPLQENVEIPVNTAALADGSHELTVTVTDAAGNSSIVYDGYISTDNAPTSAPTQVTSPVIQKAKDLHALDAKFVAIVRYRGAITRVRAITSRGLPRAAKVTISDSGPDHPRLKPAVEPAAKVKTLLRELTRLTFHAGDHLIFTVTAPGKRRERIELSFHAARDPTWKLLPT